MLVLQHVAVKRTWKRRVQWIDKGAKRNKPLPVQMEKFWVIPILNKNGTCFRSQLDNFAGLRVAGVGVLGEYVGREWGGDWGRGATGLNSG